MKLYHNSRDKKFRNPGGALKTGQTVTLRLLVCSEEQPLNVLIRLWDGQESFIPMVLEEKNENEYLYKGEVTAPQTAGLLWYYFVAEKVGEKLFYSDTFKRLGGEGVNENTPSDNSYQITVYDKDYTTPKWYREGVIYQIFPDRFFKEGDQTSFPQKQSWYRLHEDWYEDYFCDRHPFEDGPAFNDFYGGNLLGIKKKLKYLKDLGISVIYLNPIFEAFSNHRYDTGDYSRIDPVLGDENDFKELCKEAESLGIRIILDGVFSHTGSDSIYFNKYATYGETVGAARDENSPYRMWYQWHQDGGYESWWGCSNLPNVKEMSPTYLDYILRDKDAIIKKWVRLGAMGWRLDVADELPDEFIKILRSELKKENKDAVVIGEVWEDASNKISYGVQREYLYGHELDGVMNYPFKDGVLGFLRGEICACDFCEKMLSIMENYPKEALYSNMNLIGTHDTIRAKTILSGQYINNDMSFEEKKHFKLDAKAETLAIKRLKIAAFMQMTFIGVPCIYYGDEIGMQGVADPFNRMPYTWRNVDTELFDYYKTIISVRNSAKCLKAGELEFLFAKDDVLVYLRRISGGRDVFGEKCENTYAVCAINKGPEKREVEIDIPQTDGALAGKIYGDKIEIKKGKAVLTLQGYSAEIYC